MSSSPSPNSPPSPSPPPSTSSSSPPPDSPPPPPSKNPDKTADSPDSSSPSPPSSSSAPPPQSSSPPPPPPSPIAPPPTPPLSPPPSETPPPTTSPPPPPPAATPPPSLPESPPPSPPPPTSPLPITPPPASNSPPPPDPSPPPPPVDSPPPQTTPTPPAATPPPSPTASPPPPDISTPPPSSNSPPPPTKKSKSPPPPAQTPQSAPPPPSPPNSTLPSPPPSVPSSSTPTPISSPASPSNSSSASPSSSPLSSDLPEKPTAKTTTGTNVGSPSQKGGLSTGTYAAIAGVFGVLLLSLVVFAVWFAQKRKRRRGLYHIPYNVPSPFSSSQNSDSIFLKSQSPAPLIGSHSASKKYVYSSSEGGGVSSNSRAFAYEELVEATSGFSPVNLLGEGGFGCVYKGTLSDGREVAVKQLKVGGGQGEREFRAEVEIISRVHHRHLVSLVGYCISEYQRLLVYDFVQNDTLHHHLHSENSPILGWETRVRIAAGAARGIAYLHEDCHPRIIHRDIKSSNILLDSNFEAQVADFGLAKLASDTHTHVTTRVMGTFGYMAPEYATSGKLTDKSDVYSFGVVLLELITGRKSVDSSQPLGDESLVEWARPLLAQALEDERFEELADPKLDNNYVDSEMFRMIEVAAACVRHSAVKRPRMSQVVRALDSLDDMTDIANGVKPGQSGVFDSAQQSAQIRMFQRMAFGSQDYSSEYTDRSRSQSSWRSRESGEQRSREFEQRSSFAPVNRSGLWNN